MTPVLLLFQVRPAGEENRQGKTETTCQMDCASKVTGDSDDDGFEHDVVAACLLREVHPQ